MPECHCLRAQFFRPLYNVSFHNEKGIWKLSLLNQTEQTLCLHLESSKEQRNFGIGNYLVNTSIAISNLTDEQTNAQRKWPIHDHSGRDQDSWLSPGLFLDGSHSAQSYVFGFSDLNGENRGRERNCFSGLWALGSRTNMKGLGEGKDLMMSKTGQLNSQNKAGHYEL